MMDEVAQSAAHAQAVQKERRLYASMSRRVESAKNGGAPGGASMEVRSPTAAIGDRW